MQAFFKVCKPLHFRRFTPCFLQHQHHKFHGNQGIAVSRRSNTSSDCTLKTVKTSFKKNSSLIHSELHLFFFPGADDRSGWGVRHLRVRYWHGGQPIGAKADKYPWLRQRHLTWEWMPMLPVPTEDKIQRQCADKFCPVWKGYKSLKPC